MILISILPILLRSRRQCRFRNTCRKDPEKLMQFQWFLISQNNEDFAERHRVTVRGTSIGKKKLFRRPQGLENLLVVLIFNDRH